MLSVVMLIVNELHYAECHYVECYYAECRYAECHGAFTTPNKNVCILRRQPQCLMF
jgi:hypothetical protein